MSSLLPRAGHPRSLHVDAEQVRKLGTGTAGIVGSMVGDKVGRGVGAGTGAEVGAGVGAGVGEGVG